ncbi:2-oxoglutarate receptor 1-like [Protopterus annectens]|uniref:2-oxoglutarate receptor 1-like n=1 Tax=Protopterus annectens TaxID=7888 RepID=UPI001CF9DE24|nr:2-oxoglutarate receptor 1-like [Protopterus annectens]
MEIQNGNTTNMTYAAVVSKNSTSCTGIDIPLTKYYIPVMYSIICGIGLFGNVTAITVYVLKMRPWKISTIIMVNLAVTDLLYIASLPFLVEYYTHEENWTMGDFMCRFVRFGFHFNLYGSINFLTCFSIFRYIVIVHPIKSRKIQIKQWAIIACIIVWIISLAEVIPMITMISMAERNGIVKCLDFASSIDVHQVWVYSWTLTVLGYFIPLLVVSACYSRIIYSLSNGPNTQSCHKLKARRLAVIILVVFILCFLPFHILRALRIASRLQLKSCIYNEVVNAAYIVSRPLAGLNTFFNLILYVVGGDNFQQALVSLLRCQTLNNSLKHTASNTAGNNQLHHKNNP